ncbi:MAG: hypothetical protein ACAH59_07270, partial [Pseudobdellovibrionaceae bacterium]
GMYIYQSRDSYQRETERRKKIANFYLDLSAHFLMNRNSQALLPRLQTARELGEFDFFLLRKNDEVLGFYNKNEDLQGINHDYKVTDDFVESDDFAFKALAVYDYKITIGINKAEGTFLWRQLQARKQAIIQDLVLVTTMVFLIVYLILKDIVQLSKALQTRTRSNLSKIQSRSKEGDILLQATKGFERATEGLRKDNLLLASSLAPAVRAEIRSGQRPPYEFPCTLARIDLNGYTQLVLQKKPDELLHILNLYFQTSRDLIERYHGGLIYQYVGDEIIFLFKENGVLPSSVRALRAIRSLFEMAERLVSPGLPNGLRLKASLVSGSLQFVKLDQGYSFSGLPLIESVRMLGQVTEKNDNILVAYADSLKELSPYCQASDNRTTVFKGFQTESHIVEIKKFTPLVKAFEQFPLPHVAEAYRSDQDLVGILQKLYFLLHEEEDSSFFSLIAPLRSMKVGLASDEVVRAYTDLLSACLKMGENKKPESRRLASVMALSQNLLQKEQLDSEIENAIRKCQTAKDLRVQANSLIVQAFFDFDIEDLPEKMNSPSNRLAADAVLVSGRIDFDENLFKKVRDFLSSPRPRAKASGLYLIAALVEYHSDRDLVYLKANSFLRSLVFEIPNYLNDPDPMVQTRARLSWEAIQKVGLYEN